jgi:hypothetical protein
MMCSRCGGHISMHSNCEKCNISYEEMIATTRHDEMKELFRKIKRMDENHENTDIEASLLACELLNSTLLIPVTFEGDSIGYSVGKDSRNRSYILLFTDKEEYDKTITGIDPYTPEFKRGILPLLEDHDGFSINKDGEVFNIGKEYFEVFFSE